MKHLIYYSLLSASLMTASVHATQLGKRGPEDCIDHVSKKATVLNKRDWFFPKNFKELKTQAYAGDAAAQDQMLTFAYQGIIPLNEYGFFDHTSENTWLLVWLSKYDFRAQLIYLRHNYLRADFNPAEIVPAGYVFSQLLEKAQAGDLDALYWRGEFSLKCGFHIDSFGSDPNEWKNGLFSAAEQGHAAAQYCLGTHYLSAHEEEASDRCASLAFQFIENAAQQGLAIAQVNLGEMFDGENFDAQYKDEQRSFDWHMAAAKQGYSDGQGHIATIYENGKWGQPRNLDLAIMWYMKAAWDNRDVKDHLRNEFFSTSLSINPTLKVEQDNVQAEAFTLAQLGSLRDTLSNLKQRHLVDLGDSECTYLRLPNLTLPYESVFKYASHILEFAGRIANRPQGGFMITCLIPATEIANHYNNQTAIAEPHGFHTVVLRNVPYYCLCGDNPKLGYEVGQMLGKEKETVMSTLEWIMRQLMITKSIIPNFPNLIEKLDNELRLVRGCQITINEVLPNYLEQTVASRNKRFANENPWLFK